MDRDDARRIAVRYVEETSKRGGVDLEIVDSSTREEEFGWVFFYDSSAYLRSGLLSDAIAGNAPIIVDRSDGSVHETGTALSVDHYLAEYARTRAKGGGV